MPSPSPARTTWAIIIPVKETTLAKTRLSTVSAADRTALAFAFALDTVAAAVAARGVRRVVVVTNEPAAQAFARAGAEVLSDQPAAGINAAILHGAAHLVSSDASTGLAALTGDLPALTGDVLSMALAGTRAPRWFVPDTAGLGTTLLCAEAGQPLSPAFGAHSCAAHRASGAEQVEHPGLAALRRDVDTETDLWDAERLGVGLHTRTVLSRLDRERLA